MFKMGLVEWSSVQCLHPPDPDTSPLPHLVPEALHGLPLGAVQLGVKLQGGEADPHALAAAAPHGLDHDGEADLLGLRPEVLHLLVLAVVATDHRHIGRDHDLLAGGQAGDTLDFIGDLDYLYSFQNLVDLMPISRMAEEGGPTKITPA